ncbi:CDP-glycerol glycerophosphotransferase family protein [Kaistella polysaccharea]|uniref:CDP-glycerol glycerophosphotransferase family protein n=1 Tax=Kaistella polysaccharea TaxID=2878534 RepID=UPI001CF1F010|nr:CDP-glycerol glycerophosphotransferase family protein [Kaistella polysaccharea]
MLLLKIIDISKFSLAYLLSYVMRFFGLSKNIWIITERPAECKDNGYHFFKYIREKYPNQKTYYAIDRQAPDLKKITDLGQALYFNSFKHYLFSFLATRLIGAFNPVGIPNSFSFYKFPHLVKGKKVFLQHGITKEYIKSLTYSSTLVDLFCCGALPEYDYVQEFFGYPKNVVQYVGFCRYDNLNDYTLKKQILLMPTWRQFLPSQTWKMKGVKNFNELEREFLNSDYYAHYSYLLKNQDLLDFLERNDYLLIFYLHHELQQFTSLFETSNKNIVMANNSDYDVQLLLKESEFLITDYSSVAFDFAYMNKPMVYYQFDEEEYYKSHYNKGYFDYESMGFGAVARQETDLVKALINSFDTQKMQFYNDEMFTKRTHDFFTLRDTLNCKRTFDAVLYL